MSVTPPSLASAPPPAYAEDFPDPSVIKIGATYWAYGTGSGNRNLSMMSSPDLATWSDPVDALPILPSWAAPGFTWAPGVIANATSYLMYYTARVAATGQQCISVASAHSPAGPFFDLNSTPMICQLASGGSIDPFPFVAPDGRRYLLWKSEENSLGAPSRIGVRELSADGLGVVGTGRLLLTATEPWQGGVVEGPTMGFIGGHYLLFYGANHWNTSDAAIGYAACETPIGPCVNRSMKGPWMASVAGRRGPSGPEVFADGNGGMHLALHGYSPLSEGRSLWTSRLRVVNGVPELW
ncbi:MAG: glycoside hydrolase family 43 protein [Acidimicrobiales bacterium]